MEKNKVNNKKMDELKNEYENKKLEELKHQKLKEPEEINVPKDLLEKLTNFYNQFNGNIIANYLHKNPELIDNHAKILYQKLIQPNVYQRLNKVQGSLKAILKKHSTHFKNKTYSIDDLFTDLQPAINEAGLVLKYNIEFDKDVFQNPLIYYPSKEKDSNDSFRKMLKKKEVITVEKEPEGKVFKDKTYNSVVTNETSTDILGRTLLFYKFKGKWINIDDGNDNIEINFPFFVELKDQLSAEQAFGLSLTYSFRKNLCYQFQIPTADIDADFLEASQAVQDKVKELTKDNDWSTLYKSIKTNYPKSKFVIQKEDFFQNKLKPIFGDCNDFYEYLLYKYVSHTKTDIKARIDLRNEMNKVWESEQKNG